MSESCQQILKIFILLCGVDPRNKVSFMASCRTWPRHYVQQSVADSGETTPEHNAQPGRNEETRGHRRGRPNNADGSVGGPKQAECNVTERFRKVLQSSKECRPFPTSQNELTTTFAESQRFQKKLFSISPVDLYIPEGVHLSPIENPRNARGPSKPLEGPFPAADWLPSPLVTVSSRPQSLPPDCQFRRATFCASRTSAFAKPPW